MCLTKKKKKDKKKEYSLVVTPTSKTMQSLNQSTVDHTFTFRGSDQTESIACFTTVFPSRIWRKLWKVVLKVLVGSDLVCKFGC